MIKQRNPIDLIRFVDIPLTGLPARAIVVITS